MSGLKLPTAFRDHLFREHRDAFFDEVPSGVVPFFVTEESAVEGYEWDDLGTYIRNQNTCYAFLPPIYSSNRSLRQHSALVREVKKRNPEGVKVVQIPDGVDWYIDENEDGSEFVREEHRTWG